ncbi:MAG: hypothetical protein PHN84_09320 [Desulfuromonadaceae bacterium]|nr:hypothetical protein [Desulfuromonadaceae bacterium]
MRISAPVCLLLAGLILYVLSISPFVTYMLNKPIEEKLGYVPSLQVVKSLSADLKELAAASLVMKVMMYYGGEISKGMEGKITPEQIDLQGMSRLVHGAVKLDPYNMDAYYFAQGFLTWDAGQFKIANELLEYGMKFRTWDWQLPYFAGFNNAFFLKDFVKAAEFYKLAGELSGAPIYKSLAGRYLQASGQTALALAYLISMEKGETNTTLKKNYQIRIAAFREVRRIEEARDRYLASAGVVPASIEILVMEGFLSPPPSDPYGGQFVLENDGKVVTTSKFAFGAVKKTSRQRAGDIHERN